MSRLETRCDKIERRRTNLLASKATYAQQACYNSRKEIRAPPRPEPPPHQPPNPMYSQRTRRYPPHSQSRPRTPPYTSGSSSYFTPDMYGPQLYSCSDWEQPGVLSDYYDPLHERSNSSRYSVGRNAYRPPGEISDYYEPPHARSNSSWYSARQNVYRPPRNAFTSGDQFAEQERPLRQPHCARQSPNSGWSSPKSHQQPFLHVKNQTCWDLSSQTSGRRVGKIRAPPLPEHPPQLTPQNLLCQQPQNRNQRPTFPSSRTPTRPQLVLDQKPPLWSDRQLQQPSTTSTIELPPYAASTRCC
ncbi:early nodulin-75-like [Salvia splendens]|uniref:early nodulin-75-like n=1 Tax=Salvia splendens TaxID=180675 RepID=UPI001C25518E|nr:early nodulin-75-like [Salvia splendens]